MYSFLNFLFESEQYRITLKTVSARTPQVHKDFHPHYEVYFCPLEIAQDTIINGTPIVIERPSIIISSPFSVHGMSKYNGASEYFPRYAVYLSNDFIGERKGLLPDGMFEGDAGCIYLLDNDTRDFMQTIFHKMVESKDYPKEFSAHFTSAMNTLDRKVPQEARITLGASRHHYVIDVLKYVYDNRHRAIESGEVAAAFHVSRAKLDRDFRSFAGETLHKTAIKFRIGFAVELLTKTDMRVRDIAKACGFESEYYFYAFFKNAVGKTPLSVRRAGHAY